MALFNAGALLSDEKEKKVISLTCFVLGADIAIPELIIEVNDTVRETARRAAEKYNTIRIKYQKGAPEGVVTNDPVKYCSEVLEVAYKDAMNLFDEPSKKTMLALIQRQPKFARWLAGKLMDVIESSDLYVEEEEAKKN